MSLSTTEKLAYTTVRIECKYMDGNTGTGTGFFMRFLDNTETGQHIPVIITNKHVVNDIKHGIAVEGKVLFTKSDENTMPINEEHFGFVFSNFGNLWEYHTDPDIDLCAMPIAPYVKKAEEQNERLFYVALPSNIIPNENQLHDFFEVEDILMVGYPNGLWDYKNNKPIFRKGITATNVNTDYCGRKEFLIDAACIPGSSGSPVFIYNEGSYTGRDNSLYAGSRLFLVGVLYAGPQMTVGGNIQIIDVPTVQVPMAVSNIPINLGNVIKAECIKSLETQFSQKY